MTPPPRAALAGRLAGRVVGFALAWWTLSEGDPKTLTYGVAAVLTATAASMWLVPLRGAGDGGAHAGGATPTGAPGVRRLASMASLVGWFAAQLWAGAVDVARRTLTSPPDVSPVVVLVPVHLPPGWARYLCVTMSSLMPGTVVQDVVPAAAAAAGGSDVGGSDVGGSAAGGSDVGGGGADVAIIHALSDALPVAAAWRDLERRVAAAAGLPRPA